MPIFVSSAPGRTVGLQRLQGRDAEDRLAAGLALRGTRNRRDDEENRTPAARGEERQNGAAARDQLPGNSQRGEQLRAQLQGEPQAEGRSRLPAVGAVRTEAERSVDRPGRLEAERSRVFTPRTEHTQAARAQNPAAAVLERVRVNVPARERDAPALPEGQTPAALDRERDARIRLLAAQNRAQAGTAERPTAVEISRANTTPEIRENLQANAREVGQGLRQEEAAKTRRTAQQAERAAEQAGENRREQEVRSARSEVRELQTEERRLERELAQTEREIRQRQNEVSRLENGVAQRTPPEVALGPRINLLAI